MLDLIIRGGSIVNADAIIKTDIAVQDGRIVSLGDAALLGRAKRVINAAGQYVLPGLIDMHTHFEAPFMGCQGALDFYSGSVAGAFGGVTTFIDFTNTRPGDSVLARVKERREEMAKAVIDYSTHAKFVEANPQVIAEIPAIVEYGCSSIKLFMTYRKEGVMIEDDGMLAVLEAARKWGALPGVHAESNAIAEFHIERQRAKGELDWIDFPKAKPPLCEEEAVRRAILLAEAAGSPLYIFHLTSRRGLEAVRQARLRGYPVYAETCPHYLVLTQEMYRQDEGYRYIMSPPLRDADDCQALWTGLGQDVLVVSSDDCTYTLAEKTMFLPQDETGGRRDFTKVVNGVPGIETRLPLLLEEGVHQGRLTLQQLVAVASANPAKLFGLYPEKGILQPGSLADMVLVDLAQTGTLQADRLHQGIDYSVYEGKKVTGWLTMTIARGKVIVEDGNFVGVRGAGQFVRRKPFAANR